jgi:hypothetical protein
VTYACNPSYLGGRDQEDHSSKPALANSSVTPYLKKPFAIVGLVEAQGENPEFKLQYCKKKKKSTNNECRHAGYERIQRM